MKTTVRMIYKYLKRLDDVLPQLVATMLIYSLLVEVVGVWFVQDKMKYTIGLLIGTGLALFMAISISYSTFGLLKRPDAKSAGRYGAFNSIGRYLVVAVVSCLMAYYEIGNIWTWFLGVMGLKVAALTQPLIHKVFFEKDA